MYSQEADGGRHANGDVADLRHLGDVAAVTDTLQQIPGRWGVAGVTAGAAGLLARPAGLRRTVLLAALVPPAQQVLGDVTAGPAPQERSERQRAATERRAAGRRRRQRRLRLPGADQSEISERVRTSPVWNASNGSELVGDEVAWVRLDDGMMQSRTATAATQRWRRRVLVGRGRHPSCRCSQSAHGVGLRYTAGQTDRQADRVRQTNRQTDRQTDRIR